MNYLTNITSSYSNYVDSCIDSWFPAETNEKTTEESIKKKTHYSARDFFKTTVKVAIPFIGLALLAGTIVYFRKDQEEQSTLPFSRPTLIKGNGFIVTICYSEQPRS